MSGIFTNTSFPVLSPALQHDVTASIEIERRYLAASAPRILAHWVAEAAPICSNSFLDAEPNSQSLNVFNFDGGYESLFEAVISEESGDFAIPFEPGCLEGVEEG